MNVYNTYTISIIQISLTILLLINKVMSMKFVLILVFFAAYSYTIASKVEAYGTIKSARV